MDIIFLKPVYKDYIWGGTRLKKEFNKNTPYEKTAESWEVSTNKNGKSIIINGEWKDKDLDELFNNQETKESIFGKRCLQMEKFPLLINSSAYVIKLPISGMVVSFLTLSSFNCTSAVCPSA